MPRTSSALRELTGRIIGGKPRVNIELVEPAVRLNDALVDTGFDGGLVVPAGTFNRWHRSGETTIQSVRTADGRIHDCETLEVDVLWLGGRRTVRAIELGNDPTVGMLLLLGSRISLEGTEVRIALIPERASAKTAGKRRES